MNKQLELEIVELYSLGRTGKSLSLDYKISERTVYAIINKYNAHRLQKQKYKIGEVLNNLTIVTFKDRYYTVLCTCGNTKIIRSDEIRKYKSCGCLRDENLFKKKYDIGNVEVSKLLSYKNSAKNRNLVWSISDETFFKLIRNNCYYCNIPPISEIKIGKDISIINGVDRIDSSIGYIENNVVPCCYFCNTSKNDLSLDTFLKYLKHISKENIDFTKFDHLLNTSTKTFKNINFKNLKMKIYHFSDTHGMHRELEKFIPKDADILIFSGDCSNYKDVARNSVEVMDFFNWYESLPHKNKLWIAGNHCTSLERGLVKPKEIQKTTTYLYNESIIVEGVKIWASPITPSFGEWAFMCKREKIDRLWQQIPEDTDILIVHGPPKSILDLSENRNHELEFCGCNALRKHVLYRIKPKLMCFGHIHNFQGILNAGTKQVAGFETIFSNGSCVEDGRFDKGIVNNGNLITITK